MTDYEIMRPETKVGKGEGNDLVLNDPTVSTNHAVIRVEAGGYTISDLGSRNGTFVNDERVTSPRPLQDGDRLGLGRSTLKFQFQRDHGTISLAHYALPDAPQLEGPPPLTELSLARAVISAGLVERQELERLRATEAKGRSLYRTLVEDGVVSEERLRDVMSETFRLPIINLRTLDMNEAWLSVIPPQLVRRHRIFPAGPAGEAADRLTVAIADPTDADAVEDLKRATQKAVELRLATASEIAEQFARHLGPKLIGVLPSGEKFECLIDQPEIEIGNAPHNHLVLSDPTVSKTHAVVIAREGGYSIVDLGSRNGTFVNGERLGQEARALSHGDKIKLGQVLLTFRNPAETTENRTAQLPASLLEEVRRRAADGEFAAASAGPRPPQSPFAAESRVAAPAESQKAVAAQADKPPQAEAAAIDEAPRGEEKGEKKKKKKKKKDKEAERIKAAYITSLGRILAGLVTVISTLVLSYLVFRSNSSQPGIKPGPTEISKKGKPKLKLDNLSAGTPFRGGTFEASGVAQVNGTDGVLFVDDNRPGEVLWMRLDQSGNQVGEIKPVPLGVTVDDPESITYGGSYFYVASSQSHARSGTGGHTHALVRFAFDAANQRLQRPAEWIHDLRGFLLANVPELKAEGDKEGKDGGINIEGMAWDPIHERLLLGLRSPIVNDRAVVVPIKLRNPLGPFSAENLQVDEPRAIQLSLGGEGIRDLHYDTRLKSFLIISGAPEHHEKFEFKLWEWSGGSDQSQPESQPHEEATLDRKMKPEGITHVTINGRDFIFIVGDASFYLKLDYPEGQ